MLKISCFLVSTLVICGCLADNELSNIREKRQGVVGFWQNLLSPVISKEKALCDLQAKGNSLVRLGNGRAYFFSTTKVTWDVAKTTCSGMGGHLLTINNAAENSLIVFKIVSIAKAIVPAVAAAVPFWIGLNDKQTEGIFKYTYLGQSPAIAFWKTGEPVAAGAALDCVAHTAAFGDGALTGVVEWTTKACTDETFFICEFEAPCSFLLTATSS